MALNVNAILTKSASKRTQSSKRLLLFVRLALAKLKDEPVRDEKHLVERVYQVYDNLQKDLDENFHGVYDVKLCDEDDGEFTQYSDSAVFLIDFNKTVH